MLCILLLTRRRTASFVIGLHPVVQYAIVSIAIYLFDPLFQTRLRSGNETISFSFLVEGIYACPSVPTYHRIHRCYTTVVALPSELTSSLIIFPIWCSRTAQPELVVKCLMNRSRNVFLFPLHPFLLSLLALSPFLVLGSCSSFSSIASASSSFSAQHIRTTSRDSHRLRTKLSRAISPLGYDGSGLWEDKRE